MTDLSLATPEDMLLELNSRGITAAIVLSHSISHDTPHPALGGEVVFATKGIKKYGPPVIGAFLCRGLLKCLTDTAMKYPGESAEASRMVHKVTAILGSMMPNG